MEVTTSAEALRRQRAALGGSATTLACARLTGEPADALGVVIAVPRRGPDRAKRDAIRDMRRPGQQVGGAALP